MLSRRKATSGAPIWIGMISFATSRLRPRLKVRAWPAGEGRRERRCETCRLVTDAGRTTAALVGIQGEQHCRRLVEGCVEELGGVDILVDNAAYQMSRKGIADISTE